MELVPVQYCRSTEGWSPVHIESKSEQGQLHMVLVNPYVSKAEFVCDCRGFEYRGHCRHQEEALGHVCWWPMVRGEIDQTDEERKSKTCPVCEGPTKWEMIEADAEL